MIEYLELGSVPYDEDCPQVGYDSTDKLYAYVCVYAEQLERMFPKAKIRVRRYNHDFGSYYEAIVKFNPNNEDEAEAAFEAEGNLPDLWDDEAKAAIAAFEAER